MNSIRGKINFHSKDAFTFIELLVVLLIIANLIAIALPSLLSQGDKAKDKVAESTLVNATRSLKLLNTAGNLGIESALITQLRTENPGFNYYAYNAGFNPSTGPKDISVSKETSTQASLCVRSTTGPVFCARYYYAGENEYCSAVNEVLARECLTPTYAAKVLSYPEPEMFLSLGNLNGLSDLSGNSRNGTGEGGISIGTASPGPLLSRDQGATNFDGVNDGVQTTYQTRLNYHNRPLTRSGTPVFPSVGYQANLTAIAGSGQSGNTFVTRATANTTPAGGQFGGLGSTFIPAAAGEQWTISANIVSSAPNGTRMMIAAYNSSQVAIGYPYTDTTGTGIKSSTATLPANTAFIKPLVYGLGPANGDSFTFDGVLLEKSSTLRSYFPSAAQLASGEAGWNGTAYDSQSTIGAFANGTARTFMTWLWINSGTGSSVVMSNASGPAGTYDIPLRVNGDTGLAEVFIGGAYMAFDGTPFSGLRGQWAHAAVVVDEPNNTAKLYVNGQQSGSTKTVTGQWASGGLSAPYNTLSIGKYGGQYFDGKIAWMSVNQGALSAADIAEVYRVGKLNKVRDW